MSEQSGRTAKPLQETPTNTPQFRSRWVGTWAAPILVILFTLVWCLGISGLISNRTGDWQYGVFPYIPAQSFFTTRELHRQAPPSQVEYPSTVRRLAHGR